MQENENFPVGRSQELVLTLAFGHIALAYVLHALDRLPVAGRTVAVLGVGPIGLLFAHAANPFGAVRVVEVDPVD